jgi:hypothetical protein
VGDVGQCGLPSGGSPILLEDEPLPTAEENVQMLVHLPYRVADVLANDDPDALVVGEYFKLLLANSALTEKRVEWCHRDRDGEIIEGPGEVSMKLSILGARA